MIPEPGDANREVTVTETFHVQTDDELTDKELKQIEADDQAIQTILLGLPKISMLLLIAKEVDELEAERLVKTQDPLALMANSNNHYAFPAPHQDQSSFNQNYLQQPMPNPEDITDPTTTMNMALALMAKAFKLNYSSPTNNNQRISSNPRNRQITQLGMNMGQDRQMQMVGGNGRNQFRQYAGNLTGIMMNGLIGVQGNGNQNQIGNGNLVAARAEGITARKRQESNFKQKSNLQQASTSGTQTDKAPVYDSDGSAEVHENCDDNEIFNMFTQEEQYTELLKPIPELHQVPQNDNDVISEVTSVEQEETLQLTQESHEKMKQLIKEIKPANYTKINHLSGVFVPQMAKSHEELYFSNISKTANVLKSISIPNDDLSDDTTPSVARKFLNEEAAKFVGDFKSLANEADTSLAKHKALELKIKRLLKAVVSQDIMTIVQKESVIDTSDLQTELERMKERFEN
nr:hypothetical protein [Tanacetum cinerariifolium]